MQKKALVVDDSKLALFVLKKMLLEESMAVDTAETAEEALGYLVHNKPDVIFLDHSMPGMDGLQALKIIKENPDTATIPIMMYTSKEGEVYMSQARALGAVDILPKKLEPVVLNKVLRKMNLIDSTADQPAVPVHFQASEERSRTPAPDNAKELARLVRSAESALEKETLKQVINQELGQQAEALQRINQRIDSLIAEGRETRADVLNAEQSAASRGRGLAIPVIAAMLVLAGFGYGYFHLNTDIKELGHKFTSAFLEQAEETPVSSYSPASYAQLKDNVDISGLLYVLEESISNNYPVRFGQPLLGDQEMQLLANLLLSLNAVGYTGNLEVLVHSGNFCVVPNQDGKLVLPASDSPIVDCQILESNSALESLVISQLREFVNEVNTDPASGFSVSVVNWGSALPVEHYPDKDELVSAGVWNHIAQQNQRIEFVFR
jgi:CheY-like chemotaxis protein